MATACLGGGRRLGTFGVVCAGGSGLETATLRVMGLQFIHAVPDSSCPSARPVLDCISYLVHRSRPFPVRCAEVQGCRALHHVGLSRNVPGWRCWSLDELASQCRSNFHALLGVSSAYFTHVHDVLCWRGITGRICWIHTGKPHRKVPWAFPRCRGRYPVNAFAQSLMKNPVLLCLCGQPALC